jgi:hypothetical protein
MCPESLLARKEPTTVTAFAVIVKILKHSVNTKMQAKVFFNYFMLILLY